MEATLRQMVLNKGLCDNVKFLGEVPESLLQNLYAPCDIFVSPTLLNGLCYPFWKQLCAQNQ
jgi:glycosyltransferase involved in cell wall biosynthesis